MTVESTSLKLSVSSRGTVRPRVEIALIPEVDGRVIQASPTFVVGGSFKRGDLLIAIDPRKYEYSILEAKAEVAQAAKSLLHEQADADLARKDWATYGNHESPPPLTLHIPHLAEAKAALDAAEAKLARANLNRQLTELRAIFDGRIRKKSVDIGQYVSAGQELAQLYSIDSAEVRLPLTDDQLAFVDLPRLFVPGSSGQQGPGVLLKAKLAGQDREWLGVIDRTEGVVDESTRQVFAVARIQDPYNSEGFSGRAPLPVGLFVEAEIQGRTLPDVFVLPPGALYRNHEVLLVENDRVQFQAVEVLRRDEQGIVVRGLKTHQRIVISRIENVVAGMRVQVLEVGL